MKHKICIFNDRARPMRIQIQNYEIQDTFEVIDPRTHKFVEVTTTDDMVPYLKVWESGQTSLSAIDPSFFKQEGDSDEEV